MRVQASSSSTVTREVPIDREETPAEAVDRFDTAFRWLEAKGAQSAETPLVRPIVGRGLPKRVFHDIVKKRAVPLLTRLVRAQAEMRGERAERARDRTQALLERIRTFDVKKLENPNELFDEVQILSREIEGIIDDANYVAFGRVGLLHQLRALNVALRSSEKLWHAIGMGHALRDPELQSTAIELGLEARSVFDRGFHGDDISKELVHLEDRFSAFKLELDESMGRDSGLGKGLDGIRVSRRAWSYRSMVEKAILEREGRRGEHLTNRELCAWVKVNGVPLEVVAAIYEADVLPGLRAIANSEDRSRHAAELRERAQALIDRIENADPDQLRTADQIEAFAVEVGRSLDGILEDAEALAKPADGVVRKLRESRAGMDALRMLLLGLRVNETAHDASFVGRANSLVEEIQTLADGDPEGIEQRLADLESHLLDLGEETKARLDIAAVPGLDQSLALLRNVRKMIRLRDAAQMAMNPEVRRAVEAFSDLEMSASERSAIYDRALKEPLLETVVGLLLAIREVELGFSFADAGRGIEKLLHAGGQGGVNPMIAKSPLAFLARADFEQAFGRLDAFLDNAGAPDRRAAIDASLNVVRAVAAVERDALGSIAARIPEGDGVVVGAAMVDWIARSMEVLLEWSAMELAEPSGVAAADFLDLMVGATEGHLDALMGIDPRELGEQELDHLRSGIRGSASDKAMQVGFQRIPEAAQTLASKAPEGPYAKRLREINEQLLTRLESVETTEESRAAMRHLLRDVGATLRTIVNLVHLFGAASNDQMDADERAHAIQGSIERMGPLFVKLMQTLANMQSLLAKLSPDFAVADSDPLFASLKKLQDEVTPLPWKYIEDQIRSSMELPEGAPLTEAEGEPAPFVSIDQEPLKSGSIGQTHRAKIRVDGEITDVVIKVLRPGIDKTFEDTIRVTRLTLLVFKELLRLDANGSIFGEVKSEAERILAMLEQALEGFIESFRVETNFAQEAENMRKFEAMLSTDRAVVVPKVFDSHSKGNILTMEEIKGFKLSKWIERHRYAEACPPLAEEMGPLPREGVRSEAVQRARLFVEQTFAGEPLEARIEEQNGRRTTVRVRFRDFASRVVEQTIEIRAKDGHIEAERGTVSRLGAESKASAWAQKAFGLPVRSVSAEHHEERRFFGKREGYLVKVELDSKLDETALLFIDRKTGAIEPRSEIPDLTAKGLEGLRDRLTTTFGVQVARGLLHGDPHEGNFFVLPDGKTVGLIDFGLAIEVGMFDAAGPVMLLGAALLGKSKRMAEAMLSMSAQGELPEGPERDALVRGLAKQYRRIIVEVAREARAQEAEVKRQPFWKRLKASALGRFDQALEISRRSLEHVLRTAALSPSPRYLQALKATFSMGGNLAELEKIGIETPKWKRALRLFKEITLQAALRPFIGKKYVPRTDIGAPPVATTTRAHPGLERLEHSIEAGAP